MILRSPFELTRQECRSRRQALQEIRDDRAERLGMLATSRPTSITDSVELVALVGMLLRVVDDSVPPNTVGDEQTLIAMLSEIAFNKLPQASNLYDVGISSYRRPSRIIRLWPRLVLVPSITLILFRVIYGSRRTFGEHLTQVIDTVAGFWTGYLVQPFKDILDTVRTGGEEGIKLVSQEGVRADMEVCTNSPWRF